ncbi:hypothetical protein GCM10010449_34650 [Streptomyces rectiviolaceus]|uniref:Secreted protein n=1 Tax=Streptomyces rectiviolaceus TaxID=332591 RepID=A0ABP6MH54_9ACTN
MTPAAVVLPDTAVRLVRAVAGRRALQVVLLLAGLLALGFLCGERAAAVDGAPAPERARVTEPVRERVAEPVRETARDGREAVRDASVEPVADAAEPAVRTARGAVRPVVDGTTGVLEGAPRRVLPEAPDPSGIPSIPSPGAPGMSDLPGPGPGAGDDTDDGAEPSTPESAAKPDDGRGEAGARAHEARKKPGARAGSSYGTGTSPTYPGGQQTRGAALFGDDASDDADRTGHEPFPPAPGDPARTLGGQSAGDGSSTRHGDPCAASLDSRAPVRLLQGAGAGQVPAPVRERHRDILEFPG